MTGTTALANLDGVKTANGATNDTIGGTTAADRNIISGNTFAGVEFESGGNLVEGNYVGTDLTGAVAVANLSSGIYVGPSITNNTIGGTASGAGNLISGNGRIGFNTTGIGLDGTSNNLVEGNYVGTDYTGTHALGNAYAGIEIDNLGSHNTIGGTATGAGNVIAGNAVWGVYIQKFGHVGQSGAGQSDRHR